MTKISLIGAGSTVFAKNLIGDILGHPLNALGWLQNALDRQGHGLKAGEFVLLGSLVQTVWVKAGDEVVITIDGLGSASLRFD